MNSHDTMQFAKEDLARTYDRASIAQPLSGIARIEEKFFRSCDGGMIGAVYKEIRARLDKDGISFENRPLPISLMPTTVPSIEVPDLARRAQAIRKVLNRILQQFKAEHRNGQYDGPMHRFFAPYATWWDIIAQEKRTLDDIQLMRYDAVRDLHGNWSFMETNTCCPGGVIHCARIRDAWSASALGQAVIEGENIETHEVDSPYGFVRFMARLAERIDPEHPNIAILNHRGVYSNELESLKKAHAQLIETGEIARGKLVLGDLRDVTCDGTQASIDGLRLALIYNKIDQMQIDPADPEIRDWLAASRCSGTEFLNSLGAMYLAETKRVLALLSDPNWNRYLYISEQELLAMMELIPYTRVLTDIVNTQTHERSLLLRNQASFVLKADALTRGAGVYLGSAVTQQEWSAAIDAVLSHNGVAQLKCHLPTRPTLVADERGNAVEVMEYYGVDVFLFGDEFGGLVSRAHVQEIFNVGNGGRESPVLIVGSPK